MKYFKFAVVDSVTRQVTPLSDMKGVPVAPFISKIEVGFISETSYGTGSPFGYGFCANENFDPTVTGVLEEVTKKEFEAAKKAELGTRLSKLKNQFKQNINNWRSFYLENGFMFEGNWYDSDPASVSALSTAAVAAQIKIDAKDVTERLWKTKSNKQVSLTPTKLRALCGEYSNFADKLHAYSQTLKAQVDESDDPIALNLDSFWTFGKFVQEMFFDPVEAPTPEDKPKEVAKN